MEMCECLFFFALCFWIILQSTLNNVENNVFDIGTRNANSISPSSCDIIEFYKMTDIFVVCQQALTRMCFAQFSVLPFVFSHGFIHSVYFYFIYAKCAYLISCVFLCNPLHLFSYNLKFVFLILVLLLLSFARCCRTISTMMGHDLNAVVIVGFSMHLQSKLRDEIKTALPLQL